MNEYTFTLTRDQYETLLVALGYAAGAAISRKENGLFIGFLRLCNEINKNNPNYLPYELEAEPAEQAEPTGGAPVIDPAVFESLHALQQAMEKFCGADPAFFEKPRKAPQTP
jgi:hypothetical protein